MVFQPIADQTVDEIKREIEYRIEKYDNRALIENIDVRLLSNKKGFEVDVYIEYEGDEGTLSLSFDDTSNA